MPPAPSTRAARLALGLLTTLATYACGSKSSAPDAGAEAPASSIPTAETSASAPHAAASASGDPDAVTQASAPAEAAQPSVMAAGAVDGAALRKRHVER